MGPANDGFLLIDLFLCSQPPLHELGVAFQEIRRGKRHREEQQGYKDPALPKAERTGGNEKKRSDKNNGEEGAEHESSGEAARRHEFLRL